MIRSALGLFVVTLFAAPTLAQPVNLSEKSTLGDRAGYAIDLELKGNLYVTLDNGKQSIPLEARARHKFSERTMTMTDGLPTTSARHYTEATASVTLANDKSQRTLGDDRRLIIALRQRDGRICFSPAGPLTRDELELVSDHFNPQCLPGLLPGKVVNIGETWTLTPAVTQIACLFDVTLKTNLTGKLTEVKDGIAAFAIEGTAEGVETGAKVVLTVSAVGTFDVNAGRITSLTWKQRDEREQGAVNPASQVEATVTLKREAAAAELPELSDQALAAIPSAEPPAHLLFLKRIDPKGRYQMLHARDWHVTGQTDTHLIMRLLDRGEFIAQATVTVWNKMDPGKHLPVEDFKKAVASAPGWVPTKVLLERELAAGGRWVYQLTVEGKMEDAPVVQNFFLIAGPNGDQVAVTVAAKPEKVKAIANRDLHLVSGIEFGKK
jgi:hypothetical protein